MWAIAAGWRKCGSAALETPPSARYWTNYKENIGGSGTAINRFLKPTTAQRKVGKWHLCYRTQVFLINASVNKSM